MVYSQEICDNGIDDDGNGLIDLNDPGCTMTCVGLAGSNSVSLIPNPSFEEMECCPSSFSQMECATTWVQASFPTSDFMHTCGFFPEVVPQPLPDGDGLVGTIFVQWWKEYVGACLLQTMQAGKEYELHMNIAAAKIGNYGAMCGTIDFGSVDITIYGNTTCTNLPESTYGCPSESNPDWVVIGSAMYYPQNNWTELVIPFTPTMDVNAIMIGAPCTLPITYKDDQTSCVPYIMYDNLLLNTAESFTPISVSGSGTWQSNNLQVDAHPSIPNGDFQWYLDGIAMIGENDSTLKLKSTCINEVGTGELTFIQTYFEKCSSIHYNLPLPSFPIAKFALADSAIVEGLVNFVDLSDGNGNTLIDWQWDFGDGESSSLQHPTNVYKEDGTYFVKLVVSDSICSDSAIMPLEVDIFPITIYIPNAFTPNGDGINDEFIYKSFGMSEEELDYSIFNRWGEVVYSSNIISAWDGTYKGELAEEGRYIYTLSCKDRTGKYHSYSGHINLLR